MIPPTRVRMWPSEQTRSVNMAVTADELRVVEQENKLLESTNADCRVRFEYLALDHEAASNNPFSLQDGDDTYHMQRTPF